MQAKMYANFFMMVVSEATVMATLTTSGISKVD